MIPNFKDKYGKKEIFTPKMALEKRMKQGAPNFPVPKAVIFCINWDLLDYILKNNEHKEVGGFFAKCYLLNSEPILIVSKFGIGAPTTVALFEELIAYGVKNFISIGNAGSINPSVKIGDLVLCEKAIRDEGTSYHYLPPSKYSFASEKVNKILKEVLKEKELHFHSGVSWTTDAFYRETVDEVKYYQNEGVLTVELEAAALFALSEFRKVNTGVIFNISDSLADLKWKPKWDAPKVKISYKKLFEVAVETIHRIE
jgi:uridine phosphorylase